VVRCRPVRPTIPALGQTPTSADVCGTTASALEADMTGALREVAKVPEPDMMLSCRRRTVQLHYVTGTFNEALDDRA